MAVRQIEAHVITVSTAKVEELVKIFARGEIKAQGNAESWPEQWNPRELDWIPVLIEPDGYRGFSVTLISSQKKKESS